MGSRSMDETLKPIVAIRAVNYRRRKPAGLNALQDRVRYEVQFRRQDSEEWEVVQVHEVIEE